MTKSIKDRSDKAVEILKAKLKKELNKFMKEPMVPDYSIRYVVRTYFNNLCPVAFMLDPTWEHMDEDKAFPMVVNCTFVCFGDFSFIEYMAIRSDGHSWDMDRLINTIVVHFNDEVIPQVMGINTGEL